MQTILTPIPSHRSRFNLRRNALNRPKRPLNLNGNRPYHPTKQAFSATTLALIDLCLPIRNPPRPLFAALNFSL